MANIIEKVLEIKNFQTFRIEDFSKKFSQQHVK